MRKNYFYFLLFSITSFVTSFAQVPVINPISGPSSVCSAPAVPKTFTASASNSPLSYSWSTSPSASVTIGNASSDITSISFPNTNSSYTVYCYASNSAGASTTTSMVVTVFETPTVTFSGANSFCQGSSTNISASPTIISASSTLSYMWFPGGTSGANLQASPTITTTYTLVLTIGSCTNSANVTVTLNQNPTIAINSNTVCLGSSATLTTIVVGGSPPYQYTWDNGATTPYLNATTNVNTSHSVMVIDANNCSSMQQTANIVIDPTCTDVWPGDANSDGVADNLDILELALHYTQTGIPRAAGSNNWQSYYAHNWAGTITNGKNLNHSDCNGDGIIDDNDTLAIYTNYNLVHAFKQSTQTVTNPQLNIVADQLMVDKGTWGSSSVYLGDFSNTISNVNGVAFTINFDPSLIETNNLYIEYPVSFLNPSNQNLKFSRLDFNNGMLYTAISHTNNINGNGSGKVAIIHYKIKSSLATDVALNIGLLQVHKSSANGSLAPLTSNAASVTAIGASVGLKEVADVTTISVYPNPAKNDITITSNLTLEKVELLNVTGQVIIAEKASGNKHQLQLSTLSNGVYYVAIHSNGVRVQHKKIVIQN